MERMGRFIRLNPVEPTVTPTNDVDLGRIEVEGIYLKRVDEGIKKLNNGLPLFGYAVGVESPYSRGVLIYIPSVDPYDLQGPVEKENLK